MYQGMRGGRPAFSSVILWKRPFCQFLYQVVDGGDFIDFPGIGTAEDQTVVHVSFYGTDEGLGNAVGGGAGITGFQAVEAVCDGYPPLLES